MFPPLSPTSHYNFHFTAPVQQSELSPACCSVELQLQCLMSGQDCFPKPSYDQHVNQQEPLVLKCSCISNHISYLPLFQNSTLNKAVFSLTDFMPIALMRKSLATHIWVSHCLDGFRIGIVLFGSGYPTSPNTPVPHHNHRI